MQTIRSRHDIDIAVVGGGAAGLATAIFATRAAPGRSVAVFDRGARPGAKILVSGGGRCNVTNARVGPADYHGGSRHTIGCVLREFPVSRTVAFFGEIGVPLHEEEHGKLFPDSHRARDVLDALLREAARCGVRIHTQCAVTSIVRGHEGFQVTASRAAATAGRVVLATGGLSLPKTGCDGSGYGLARGLGHSVTPTTPALVPLVLEGRFHEPLSGLSHDAELGVRVEEQGLVRFRGPMLWTHFGVSGPVVLDASRVWHRARVEGRGVAVTAGLLPGHDFASAERRLMALAEAHPKARVRSALADVLPARLAHAACGHLGFGEGVLMSHLPREQRRRLVHALLAWPLEVRHSLGYAHAEVTAGGVPLREIHPSSMESRVCPGLYLVGEILDVDGRIGGFNFQWAWASAWVAGRAAARSLAPGPSS